jgi:hypothetical protein
MSQTQQQVGAGHPPVDQEPALRFKLSIRQVGHVDVVKKQVGDVRFRITLFWNDKSHHELPKRKQAAVEDAREAEGSNGAG